MWKYIDLYKPPCEVLKIDSDLIVIRNSGIDKVGYIRLYVRKHRTVRLTFCDYPKSFLILHSRSVHGQSSHPNKFVDCTLCRYYIPNDIPF